MAFFGANGSQGPRVVGGYSEASTHFEQQFDRVALSFFGAKIPDPELVNAIRKLGCEWCAREMGNRGVGIDWSKMINPIVFNCMELLRHFHARQEQFPPVADNDPSCPRAVIACSDAREYWELSGVYPNQCWRVPGGCDRSAFQELPDGSLAFIGESPLSRWLDVQGMYANGALLLLVSHTGCAANRHHANCYPEHARNDEGTYGGFSIHCEMAKAIQVYAWQVRGVRITVVPILSDAETGGLYFGAWSCMNLPRIREQGFTVPNMEWLVLERQVFSTHVLLEGIGWDIFAIEGADKNLLLSQRAIGMVYHQLSKDERARYQAILALKYFLPDISPDSPAFQSLMHVVFANMAFMRAVTPAPGEYPFARHHPLGVSIGDGGRHISLLHAKMLALSWGGNFPGDAMLLAGVVHASRTNDNLSEESRCIARLIFGDEYRTELEQCPVPVLLWPEVDEVEAQEFRALANARGVNLAFIRIAVLSPWKYSFTFV